MSILVTGAAGFIGSHLCRELVTRGHEVAGLTHTGRTDAIAPLQTHGNFHPYSGDIQDTAAMRDIIERNRIETVFHLAARLPAEKDTDDPQHSFDTNARGTLSLLKAAAPGGVKTFIYTSSMSVYSEPPEYLPVDEKHTARPATIYGITKLTGELYCHSCERDMKIIILRYGGIYGKRCRETDAVPAFFRQALANEPIIVFGDGEQSSDFLYIEDAIEGTMLAWERDEPETYNIGSGEETTARELAEMIKMITGAKSEIIVKGNEIERPFRFVLDIAKARKLTGYSPRPLEEGLRRYAGEIGH